MPIIPKPYNQNPRRFDYFLNNKGMLVIKPLDTEKDNPASEYQLNENNEKRSSMKK